MSEYELYHYGVKGMKWSIRRRTPEEKAAARRAKGEKKQAKIVKKQGRLKSDNEVQKETIRTNAQNKRALNAQKSASTLEKNRLDRKIGTDAFFTKWGQRRAQDKSFNLNIEIKKLEEDMMRTDVSIQEAIDRMNVNNIKISKLDKKYERIGRRYLGVA